MISIPALEWHITDACNFTCEGCAHFSNHGLGGVFSYDEIESWYKTWSARVIPERMAILGGEPLLHRRVVDLVRLTRQYWNSPDIKYFELVTNGFLLDRYPDLPEALAETGCTLAISMHDDRPEYLEKFSSIMALANAWRNRYGIDVHVYNSNTDWLRIYRGWGRDLQPYKDGNPDLSWDNCITGQQCWQLYHNKIYKCPMVAYLPRVKDKYDLSADWDPYLDYQALTADATDQEIADFFQRGSESVCGMCPTNPEVFKKQDPTKPIKFYKKNHA